MASTDDVLRELVAAARALRAVLEMSVAVQIASAARDEPRSEVIEIIAAGMRDAVVAELKQVTLETTAPVNARAIQMVEDIYAVAISRLARGEGLPRAPEDALH